MFSGENAEAIALYGIFILKGILTMKKNTKKLCLAGICLALCLVLPFFTGQIPEIGNMLSPMHIPVLLCGFICGPVYGALVGFIAPFIRYFLFQMPPLIPSVPGGPSGLSMAFEMAAYGFVAGICIKLFSFSLKGVYASLIAAMLIGRVVWGIASYLVFLSLGMRFTMQLFIAGAFINAIPAIILHLLIIPPVVMAVRKAGI